MVAHDFIFLDEGLRLSQATERAASLLGISDQDVGQPVAGLSTQLGDLHLDHGAQRVLDGEEIVEHEVHSDEGRRIRVVYHPYRLLRGEGEGSTGVVVAFADVTDSDAVHPTRGLRSDQPSGRSDELEGDAGAGAGSPSSTPELASASSAASPLREQGSRSSQSGSPEHIVESERTVALERRLEKQADEIRRLNREVSLAERSERDRIARILHDEFQQILYALKIRIDAVLSGASIGAHGAALRELIEQATVLTRTLVGSLAPPIYESDDLIASLDWLADYVGDRFGVLVEVSYDEPLPTCNEERRVLLFEAVREFLFNVVKHAGTDKARVSVRGEADHIAVVVEDEGQGFDAATLAGERRGDEHWNDELPEGSYGLAQIRRCLHLVGGRLTVESVLGAGTQASAVVPLNSDGLLNPVN